MTENTKIQTREKQINKEVEGKEETVNESVINLTT